MRYFCSWVGCFLSAILVVRVWWFCCLWLVGLVGFAGCAAFLGLAWRALWVFGRLLGWAWVLVFLFPLAGLCFAGGFVGFRLVRNFRLGFPGHFVLNYVYGY